MSWCFLVTTLVLGGIQEADVGQQGQVTSSEAAIDRPRPARGRIYDCGANVVFCMARLFGVNITYWQALELVPIRRLDGNNMFEVKAALSALDCQMEGFWPDPNELAELTLPAIVLHRLLGGTSSCGTSERKVAISS
ncbi:MAG: hypothetical protein QHH07_03030 [Sedimentisphaerales bacterium]|jgi:hypothetical protein|nr:hypothetical protein [Sedimentisphaerales bacterium]